MKAINGSILHPQDGLVSSFSLTEKPIPRGRDRDEHSQTGILTWGLSLLPPSRRFPGQWPGGSS